MDQRDDPLRRYASHGSGKRHWGVARFAGRGHIRWFASWQAAQRLADHPNSCN